MNLSMEVALGRHASVGGIFGFKSWDRFLIWDNSPANLSKWRHLALVPEFRYYLDAVSQGHYFGADLLYVHYNLGAVRLPFRLYPSLRDERVQGDLLGAGVFYGYSWPLSRHWRIEAELGISGGWPSLVPFPPGREAEELSVLKTTASPSDAVPSVYSSVGCSKSR